MTILLCTFFMKFYYKLYFTCPIFTSRKSPKLYLYQILPYFRKNNLFVPISFFLTGFNTILELVLTKKLDIN